jgi:hypothetical protein
VSVCHCLHFNLMKMKAQIRMTLLLQTIYIAKIKKAEKSQNTKRKPAISPSAHKGTPRAVAPEAAKNKTPAATSGPKRSSPRKTSSGKKTPSLKTSSGKKMTPVKSFSGKKNNPSKIPLDRSVVLVKHHIETTVLIKNLPVEGLPVHKKHLSQKQN